MKEAKRSLLATLGVVIVIGTVVMGGMLRNRMEIGAGLSVGEPITMDSIVSLDNEVPGNAEVSNNPIAESAFFYQLTLLLEREFVDPVEQNENLAVGAVRSMVNSLADSYSIFYTDEQMVALNARRNGTSEGIGVEIKLQYNEEELAKLQNYSIGTGGADGDVNFDPLLLIPSLVVKTVFDGSPADRAGMKAGDRITQVNEKWALSSLEVVEMFNYQDQDLAGEITTSELHAISEEFRLRRENSITPSRASDLLIIGTSGEVEVEWDDTSGEHHSAQIQKSLTSTSAITQNGDEVSLRFYENAFDEVQKFDWPTDSVTIDLRNSTLGDYSAMRDCLGFFAGKENFGTIERAQAGSKRTLQTTGQPFNREIKLIVDDSTWGAAAVFATALVSTGKAEILRGELTTNLPWVELYRIPGGSGYTLKTGDFKPAKEIVQ